VLDLLSRLVPALLRHVIAYSDLFLVETAAAGRHWRRQLLGIAIVLAASGVAALLACAWVIAATWDGPHRLLAIGGLFAGFVVVALGGAWYATNGWTEPKPRPFERIAAEWREDLRQLVILYPTLAGIDHSGTAPPDVHVD
jgi:Putative Actinobacterial Holin-X, holin superfamily III